MLGIGVVTYMRREKLQKTLDKLLEFTTGSYEMAVADDGSSDDTREMLEKKGITYVTGPNRGVSWNKNRAIFFLKNIKKCDTVILIEDDTFPTERCWQDRWCQAASEWGHVNFAASWPEFRTKFISGSGSVLDPFISPMCSGQCTAFSREALEYVGYLDTRFVGFGYGHGEHSQRFLRMGYGGYAFPHEGNIQYRFKLLADTFHVDDDHTFSNVDQLSRKRRHVHKNST